MKEHYLFYNSTFCTERSLLNGSSLTTPLMILNWSTLFSVGSQNFKKSCRSSPFERQIKKEREKVKKKEITK